MSRIRSVTFAFRVCREQVVVPFIVSFYRSALSLILPILIRDLPWPDYTPVRRDLPCPNWLTFRRELPCAAITREFSDPRGGTWRRRRRRGQLVFARVKCECPWCHSCVHIIRTFWELQTVRTGSFRVRSCACVGIMSMNGEVRRPVDISLRSRTRASARGHDGRSRRIRSLVPRRRRWWGLLSYDLSRRRIKHVNIRFRQNHGSPL